MQNEILHRGMLQMHCLFPLGPVDIELLATSHQFFDVSFEVMMKAWSASTPQTPLQSTPFPQCSLDKGSPKTSSGVFLQQQKVKYMLLT